MKPIWPIIISQPLDDSSASRRWEHVQSESSPEIYILRGQGASVVVSCCQVKVLEFWPHGEDLGSRRK